MSASLVGSEMCIRDSPCTQRHVRTHASEQLATLQKRSPRGSAKLHASASPLGAVGSAPLPSPGSD
eukprot:1650508-Alexandrium_andersonii.AAC.1